MGSGAAGRKTTVRPFCRSAIFLNLVSLDLYTFLFCFTFLFFFVFCNISFHMFFFYIFVICCILFLNCSNTNSVYIIYDIKKLFSVILCKPIFITGKIDVKLKKYIYTQLILQYIIRVILIRQNYTIK